LKKKGRCLHANPGVNKVPRQFFIGRKKEIVSEPGFMGFYDYHDFEYTEKNHGNPLIL
jgi:hypothetical protein